MTIRKKSKEELQNQAEWFLDYAEREWRRYLNKWISKVTRKKISETLWLSETDKKWFCERLCKKFWKELDIWDEKEIKKILSRKKFDFWLFSDWVEGVAKSPFKSKYGINSKKIWEEYTKYVASRAKAKHLLEKYESMNPNLYKVIFDFLFESFYNDEKLNLVNLKVFLGSNAYKQSTREVNEYGNIKNSDIFQDFLRTICEYRWHKFYGKDKFVKILNWITDKEFKLIMMKAKHDEMNDKKVTIFNDEQDMDEYLEFKRHEELFESCGFWLEKFLDTIVVAYDSRVGWDKSLYEQRMNQRRKFLNYLENFKFLHEKFKESLEEDFYKSEDIPDIAFSVKPENLKFIFEKYAEQNEEVSITNLKLLTNLLGSLSIDNLKIIFEKFKIIDLIRICDSSFWMYNLKDILEKFDDISDINELDQRIIRDAKPENLKIVFEEFDKQGKKLTINDLKNLAILLKNINPESLKIIFNEYEWIQIDELSEIKDNFRASDPANIELLFNYFNWLELIELINSKVLTFQGVLPKDITFKEDNHKWYLKDLVEIANMGYSWSKKINMMKKLCSLTFPQAKNYIEIFKIFDESISMDIQRIKDELIEEILNADNPKDIADQINGIFERNNLPLTWKVFKVFELLYPKEKLDYELKPDSWYWTLWSPVLNSFREWWKLKEWRWIYDLIYKDLMNIAIKSGDRSLREYLKVFIWSEELLGKFEEIIKKEWFNPDDNLCLEWKLDEEKQAQLLYLFRRISVLYDRYYWKQINEWNSIEDKKYWNSTVADNQLVKLYNDIKKWFRLKKWESLYDRLQRFLWWLWYHSFKEVLDKMDESKRQAHERWLKLYNEAVWWKINFPNHAFLKWVDEDAFSKIINRWITSREYLWWWDDWKDSWNEWWNWAWSDCTPFDIDWYYVDKQTQSTYWLVNLVLDTDRWDFVNTTIEENPNWLSWYNENQYELFKTWWWTHYWIRTWIPTTEIDYIIYRWSFNRTEQTLVPTEEHPEWEYIETFSKFQNMCYEIARNWYYIPIVDEEWNIKFTPEMYHKIRSWFNYMEYYDGYDVGLKDWKYISRTSDNTVNKTYNGDNEKIKDSELSVLISENSPKNERYQKFAEENRKLAEKTIEWIKKILEDKCGIKFNNLNDSSITWAELHDTWSTWRWTDIPTKDVDLDFTLLLDAKDYERIDEIKRIIHEEIWTQNDNDHDVWELWNQIKSKINNIWKSDERKNWVPLDLLILKKSQIIDYSSSDAMKEKLDYIESISQTWSDDLERVRTNVIIMKKLLKAKSCYKHPEWWFAWIWVENWITQHHWSFVEALESFEEVAYWWNYEEWKNPLPLEDFKEKYPMYDAWENYKLWCNDNFVYQIDKHGGDTAYQKILQIVKTLRLEWIDWIREIIKEYEDKKSKYIE